MKPTNAAARRPINKFAQVCGFVADDAHADAVAELESRLRGLSPEARKLLAHITNLATRSQTSARKKYVGYLPELHETCGLDVDAMYLLLQELETAHCIQLEGEYPFQDVLLASELNRQPPLLAELARFCSLEKISLRDMVVDVNFDALH